MSRLFAWHALTIRMMWCFGGFALCAYLLVVVHGDAQTTDARFALHHVPHWHHDAFYATNIGMCEPVDVSQQIVFVAPQRQAYFQNESNKALLG